MEYSTNNKRKPRKNDGIHIIKCILRSINEMFHISPEFFQITQGQYDDFFKQLEETEYIRRIKEGDYLAENFNITIEGMKFLKKKINLNIDVEQQFNYLIGSTKSKLITKDRERRKV